MDRHGMHRLLFRPGGKYVDLAPRCLHADAFRRQAQNPVLPRFFSLAARIAHLFDHGMALLRPPDEAHC